MPDRKHWVAGPRDRTPTGEEALEMGRRLFDAIEAERLCGEALGYDGEPTADGFQIPSA